LKVGGYGISHVYVDPSQLDGAFSDDELNAGNEFADVGIEADQDAAVILKEQHGDIEIDADVAERARKADAVLDRILADQKLRTNDPNFAQLAKRRNQFVEAQRAITTAAVGSDCDEDGSALLGPDEKAPAYDTPKGALGFKVEKARPRRV
jgi:hypothetical protein